MFQNSKIENIILKDFENLVSKEFETFFHFQNQNIKKFHLKDNTLQMFRAKLQIN